MFNSNFSFHLHCIVSDYDTDMKKKLSEEYQDPEVQPGLWEGDIAPNVTIALFEGYLMFYENLLIEIDHFRQILIGVLA